MLPNGDFEVGPKSSELKGSIVTTQYAIPHWTISGFVEYIKSGQKQGDMVLVVPQGNYAVRLGNEASIKQKIQVVKGMFYSVTLSASRTCAQEEKLNVSVVPSYEKRDWGVFPIQTMYGSNGCDSYACGFQADYPELEIVIHNPGMDEDPACGPLIDSVALKVLHSPKRTRGQFSILIIYSLSFMNDTYLHNQSKEQGCIKIIKIYVKIDEIHKKIYIFLYHENYSFITLRYFTHLPSYILCIISLFIIIIIIFKIYNSINIL